MSKIVEKLSPDKVRSAVNRIAEPVIQTLTPLGNNVMFEKDLFTLITNDGVTIARMIDSEDEVEDAVIQMVKAGSLATNQMAGDGTSTTILLTKKLVDMGLDAIENGQKPMLLKKEMLELKDTIVSNAEEMVTKVTEDDYEKIATVSSSGDTELAKKVVDVIETAGLDGMIFLEDSKNGKTNIIKDTGYNIEEKMFDFSLGNVRPGEADYSNPYVFITDKKLYHVPECKEILEQAYKSGAREVVIFAQEFAGESASFFIGNHKDPEVPLNVLIVKYPIKDGDTTPLYDLATYIGGTVVEDKLGDLTGKLTEEHFTQVERVYSAGPKTIVVSSDPQNEELMKLVEDVRKKKDKNPDDDAVSKRLAALTTGTVRLEVGGATGPELRELMFRYQDAVEAVRAAMRSGYVTGGGLTLFNSTRDTGEFGEEFGKTSIKQIAHNCGIDFSVTDYSGTVGYNAKTDSFEDLSEAGVIEPFDVFKHSVTNAFSIATAILTSGYIIVNKIDKEDN
tara:strand:+ start:7858 stop:9375 length:1518 start_codon:yes stop_codon:yes gene_type:complete